MTTRSELERIVTDASLRAGFDERLKRQHNFHLLAFWASARALRLALDEGSGASATDFEDRLEKLERTYMDTESSYSVALSFKSKERYKRARGKKVPDDIKRALNQCMLEVEMLLVSEVKSFLSEPSSGNISSSTESSTSSPAKSPRATFGAATPRPSAETRSDRAQSEFTGHTSSASQADYRHTTTSRSPGGFGQKVKDSVRSFSVSADGPSKAARRAVLKGQGSSGERLASTATTAPSTTLRTPQALNVHPAATSGPRATGSLAAWIWGESQFGQMGSAESTSSPVPIKHVPGSKDGVAFVQCTDSYTVVVDVTGHAYCAGKLTDSTDFVPIFEGHTVRQVGCGLQFCIALLDSGRLLYYGANRALEKLRLPEVVTKIVCGGRHCLALTVAGNVYSWGSDESKQLGHGSVERVPKPKLLDGLSNIVDIATGKNSSACVSSLGVVSAWGAVVPEETVTVLEELSSEHVFRLACSDRFVAAITDLGGLFIWHLDALPNLGIAAAPKVVSALQSSSIFHVECSDCYIVAITDSGDVISWGEYGSHLGQGARKAAKRYADSPVRLKELSNGQVRHISASDLHVVVATGDGASQRELLLWNLFIRERSYCLSLQAMAEHYSKLIKIKETPMFAFAQTLLNEHSKLIRTMMHALETTFPQSSACVASAYAKLLANSEVVNVYQMWVGATSGPLEKLARPKFVAQLSALELDVDHAMRKSDSQADAAKSFALVSLLCDPTLYIYGLASELEGLLAATPASMTAERVELTRAIGGARGLSGSPSLPLEGSGPASSLPVPVLKTSRASSTGSTGSSPGSRTDSGSLPRAATLRSTIVTQALMSAENATTEEQMQTVLRFRALKTELDIFQDANAQLVSYARALEEEIIGGNDSGSGGESASCSALDKIEQELVDLARENAELKARLKIAEVYKIRAAEKDGDVASSRKGSGGSAPLLKAKSTTAMLDSPSMARKSSSGSPSSSFAGRATMSLTNALLDEGKEHESLRKRINPVAGRLMSEGPGAAAASLDQFTFDAGSDSKDAVGVQYEGTQLKAATLEKLLEHLTQSSGSLALDTFLISYRNFSTPQDIFRRLVYMYCVAPAAKSKVVWVRLLNFLKSWVVKYFDDWRDEPELRKELFAFLDEIVIPSNSNSTSISTVNTIRERFSSAKLTERQMSQRYLTTMQGREVVPVVMANYKPVIIAEQLTLSEHDLYRAITGSECFNQNWLRKSEGLSPNIVELTTRFNKLSRWLASDVLQHADVRERKNAMERLIAIGQHCREIRSFGVLMIIMGSLGSSPIFRLRKTWESLSRSSMARFEELKELVRTEQNFLNLRQATKIAELPCLPYIGTFLGDLTFIDAGPDYTAEGLINWSKFQSTANTVLQLQAKQKTAYAFEVLSDWQRFLSALPDFSEAELYEMSKKVEVSK